MFHNSCLRFRSTEDRGTHRSSTSTCLSISHLCHNTKYQQSRRYSDGGGSSLLRHIIEIEWQRRWLCCNAKYQYSNSTEDGEGSSDSTFQSSGRCEKMCCDAKHQPSRAHSSGCLEALQTHYPDQVAEATVGLQRGVPAIQTLQKRVKAPQIQHFDQVANVIVVLQRQAPLQKTVEVPETRCRVEQQGDLIIADWRDIEKNVASEDHVKRNKS